MSDNRTHSRFGGSKAPRYMNCVGSVAATAGLPDPSGSDAKGGTATHRLAELCLIKNVHPNTMLGRQVEGVPVTTAMCDAVVLYLNEVETEIAQTRTATYAVEAAFEMNIPSCEPGEVFGRTDLWVYHHETKRLRIFDFKNGFQPVEPDIPSLKFYAAGVVFSHPEWKLREIVLTVVQPNALGAIWDKAIKNWTFDVVELLEFKGDVEDAIARAKAFERDGHGQDVFKVGPWCDSTYCPAKRSGTCPAVLAEGYRQVGMDFDGTTPPSLEEITPAVLPKPETIDMDRLARIKAGVGFWATWASQCEKYFDSLILNGATHPSVKVVEALARAKWIDDPAEVAAYMDAMFDIPPERAMPPKLITITEAEKVLKAAGATKDQVDTFKLKFTIKEPSGPVVVAATDRRPPIDAASDFAGVNVTAIAAE